MVEVGPLSGFVHGKPVPVLIGHRAIALVRWHDEVYAIKNVCPHQNCRLDAGRVRAALKSGPVVDADDPLIVCPWHQWTFRLKNGRCTSDPKARIKTYETEIVDGVVFLYPNDPPRASTPSGAAS
jgi:nitrite reductase/ring-hydroxylating ferredoxin subunit